MRWKRWFLFLLLISGLAGMVAVQASAATALPGLDRLKPFVLEGDWSGQFLGPYLYLEQSPDRGLSPEAALDSILQNELQPYQGQRPNFGLSTDAHFALFVLENRSGKPISLYLENNLGILDYFFLYRLDATGRPQVILRSGDQVPISERSIVSRVTNGLIDLEPGRHYFLVKAYGDTCLQLPLRVFKPLDFVQSLAQDNLMIGVLLGFHLVMILYNAFLWASVRQRVYLYYIILVTANTVFHVCNLGLGQYLAWLFFGAETLHNSVQLASVDVIIIAGLLFTKTYLEMGRWTRYRWLLWVMYVNIAFSLFNLSVNHFISHNLTSLFTLIGALFCINSFVIAGFLSLSQGFKPARYFLVGWGFYLLGSSEVVAVNLGWAEATNYNYWAQLWGGAAEVALFSIALGVRLKFLQNLQSKRIAALNEELKDLNHGLELRVEERTRDIGSILSHLQEGVFTIGGDLCIQPEYSPYLRKIFPVDDFSGASLVTLLKNCSDLGSNAIDQLENSIKLSVGEDEIAMRMNEGNFPKSCLIKDAAGQARMVEMDWVSVPAAGKVEKILVSIRDVTETRKLHASLEQKSKELHYISELIEVTPDQFLRFSKMAHDILQEIARMIRGASSSDDDLVRTTLINYHTLKGISRTMGFTGLSDLIHEAEQQLVSLRDQGMPFDRTILEPDFRRIQAVVADYQETNDVRLERKEDAETIRVKRQVVIDMIHGIEDLGHDVSRFLGPHTRYLKQLYYRPLEDIVYDQLGAIKSLSGELGKVLPRIIFEGLSYGLEPKAADIFEQVLIHLIRNTMDHGIEKPQDRIRAGKAERGSISFVFTSDHEGFRLKYSDDGAGLDLEAIRAKARSMGMEIPESGRVEDIAMLIFKPGFSTKDHVTSVSGRGVGMDAVRSLLEKIGSSIRIDLRPLNRVSTEGGIPFSFHIFFPPTVGMEVGVNYEKRALAI